MENEVVNLYDLSPQVMKTLFSLYKLSEDKTQVQISTNEIAKFLNISQNSVREHLKTLANTGFIEIQFVKDEFERSLPSVYFLKTSVKNLIADLVL
jgi:DNA-binding MarR family transcriptional regulator